MPTMMLNTPPLLQAHQLAFARNDEPVFGPLDFHVAAGEALLVQGGNGSGKTTLLRVLAGLLGASGGDVQVNGKPAEREAIAEHTALLGHLLGHKGELSADENLRFALGLYGQREGITRSEALQQVGLAGFEDTFARRRAPTKNRDRLPFSPPCGRLSKSCGDEAKNFDFRGNRR